VKGLVLFSRYRPLRSGLEGFEGEIGKIAMGGMPYSGVNYFTTSIRGRSIDLKDGEIITPLKLA